MDKKNVVVLGASFDSVEDNRAFAEKFGFPFPLLCDPDRALGLLYGAADEAGKGGYAKRIAYLIDEKGSIAKVWPKATPATFVDEVLAAV